MDKTKLASLMEGVWLGVGFGLADMIFTLITKLCGLYNYFYAAQ